MVLHGEANPSGEFSLSLLSCYAGVYGATYLVRYFGKDSKLSASLSSVGPVNSRENFWEGFFLMNKNTNRNIKMMKNSWPLNSVHVSCIPQVYMAGIKVDTFLSSGDVWLVKVEFSSDTVLCFQCT